MAVVTGASRKAFGSRSPAPNSSIFSSTKNANDRARNHGSCRVGLSAGRENVSPAFEGLPACSAFGRFEKFRRFNGAAFIRTRKASSRANFGDVHDVLQWGRVPTRKAKWVLVRLSVVHLASMGPRS